MALLWMDGFDKNSVDADIANRGYTVNTTNTHFLATGGRGGAGAVQVVAANTTDFAVPFLCTGGNIIHTAAWYKFSTSTPVGQFWGLYNSAKSQSANLGAIGGGNGTLEATNWNGGTNDSASGVLTHDVFQHIETAMQFADAGFIKVWVDGTLVINFTGDTTPGITGNGPDIAWLVIMKPVITGTATIIDDLVIWDETGTVWNTTQIGKHKIETLTPTGAGNHTDFTPDAGSNYARVADAGGHDGDSSYVEATTIGAKDSYAMSDLSSNPAAVHGVQVVSYAKFGTASCNMANLIRSGTTETQGSSKTLTSTYAPQVDFFTKDPATTAAFTQSGVNGLEVGVSKLS